MLNSLSSSWPTPVVKLLCSHVMHSFHILNAYQQFAILSSFFVFSRFFTTILYSIFFPFICCFSCCCEQAGWSTSFSISPRSLRDQLNRVGIDPVLCIRIVRPPRRALRSLRLPVLSLRLWPSVSIYIYIAPPSCTLAPLQTTSGFNL
jgi:hypothetical protein